MKYSKFLKQAVCLVLLGFLFANYSFGQGKSVFKYAVQINNGTERYNRDTVITSNRQLTALEALLYVASVETQPVEGYVFVTSIDGINGQRGITAWYYEVNGRPSKTLAINNTLKNGDVIRWTYKKDVCSGKVDKKCNQ